MHVAECVDFAVPKTPNSARNFEVFVVNGTVVVVVEIDIVVERVVDGIGWSMAEMEVSYRIAALAVV